MGAIRALKRLGLIKPKPRNPTSDYYQKLHDSEGGGYQANWLLSEEARLVSCAPRSLVEIGFGNGRFLRQVADKVESVKCSSPAGTS